MAELSLRPLLAHRPEAHPPENLRVLVLPAILAILGMLIAWAAVTAGQDERRGRELLDKEQHHYYWESQLRAAQLRKAPAEEIARLDAYVRQFPLDGRVISYARWGRQFTPWDGYRYEEIVENGYVFHQPNATEEEKKESLMPLEPGAAERRQKNVVWYPLYPLLGWIVSHGLGIPANDALTAVSWTCCLAAAMVLFLFCRRHYFNRMPALDLGGQGALAVEAHPAPRWDLSPQDTAALWAVIGLLLGPCSVFLYANFTESLFVLLLALFLYCLQGRRWWAAAMVAALASACRSQGVLFGPVLVLTFLLRSDSQELAKGGAAALARKIGIGAVLGLVSAIGIFCYMVYLKQKFGDPLAFMYGQRYWNVGIDGAHLKYALNPVNAMTRVMNLAFYAGPVDWPRLWEALCLIWPPILLLLLGGRYLSFELELVGWILWGLPYVSNSLAGNPPMDTQWMSMGRFMAVMIPAFVIAGAVFVRLRWLGLMFMVAWVSAFAIFCYRFGDGAWVG